jgi:hypothetical protein
VLAVSRRPAVLVKHAPMPLLPGAYQHGVGYSKEKKFGVLRYRPLAGLIDTNDESLMRPWLAAFFLALVGLRRCLSLKRNWHHLI